MTSSPMLLRHYSAVRWPDSTWPWLSQPMCSYKPHGLWLSDDADEENSWPAWCRAENFRLAHLRFQHRATLAPTSRILLLQSSSEIDEFDKEYGVAGEHSAFFSSGINWSSVSTRYQGIIITPYQWSCRNQSNLLWYYGWDCASGCIWDLSALEKIEFEVELEPSLTLGTPA